MCTCICWMLSKNKSTSTSCCMIEHIYPRSKHWIKATKTHISIDYQLKSQQSSSQQAQLCPSIWFYQSLSQHHKQVTARESSLCVKGLLKTLVGGQSHVQAQPWMNFPRKFFLSCSSKINVGARQIGPKKRRQTFCLPIVLLLNFKAFHG